MYRAYRIEEGDNINSISYKTNTSIDELRKINANFNVYPGEVIVVPVTSNMFDKYIVEKGDSIYSISNKYNVNYKDLLLLNGLNDNEYIYPGQEILIPKTGVSIYVTKENDTIKDIVKNIGINGYEVLLQNDNLIVLKDQLVVYKKRF